MHLRDFPLVDAVMDSRGCAFPSSPITASARTCQRLTSPKLAVDPYDTACRTSRKQPTGCVVWQPTGYLFCMCYVYVCEKVVELWVEVGQNKHNSTLFIFNILFIVLIHLVKINREEEGWKYFLQE